MKFEVRWSNGYWKVFSLEKYADLAKFETRKEAEMALGKLGRFRKS